MASYLQLIGPSLVLAQATKVPIEPETKPKLAIGKLSLVHKLIEKHIHLVLSLDDRKHLLSQAVNFARGGF